MTKEVVEKYQKLFDDCVKALELELAELGNDLEELKRDARDSKTQRP